MKEREGAASPTCTVAASLIAVSAAATGAAISSVGEQVQLFAPNHPSRLDQTMLQQHMNLFAYHAFFVNEI